MMHVNQNIKPAAEAFSSKLRSLAALTTLSVGLTACNRTQSVSTPDFDNMPPEKLVQVGKQSIGALQIMERYHAYSNNWPVMLSAANEAIKIDTHDVGAWVMRARANYYSTNFSEARRDCAKIKEMTDNAGVLTMVEGMQSEMKRVEGSLPVVR